MRAVTVAFKEGGEGGGDATCRGLHQLVVACWGIGIGGGGFGGGGVAAAAVAFSVGVAAVTPGIPAIMARGWAFKSIS